MIWTLEKIVSCSLYAKNHKRSPKSTTGRDSYLPVDRSEDFLGARLVGEDLELCCQFRKLFRCDLAVTIAVKLRKDFPDFSQIHCLLVVWPFRRKPACVQRHGAGRIARALDRPAPKHHVGGDSVASGAAARIVGATNRHHFP
eukprot:SAG11_NODE_1256_length_5374_cov_5.627627_3_plen_143_part_00